jgi:5'-3' exonuclease
MGVPGFFSWLLKNKKKLGAKGLILSQLETKIKWLMLDTNCLLHPCVANILEKYKEGMLAIDPTKDTRTQIEYYIWEKVKSCIDDMIKQIKPEYIYVGIDGVAPMGKILQQRQRRYRFLFDKKIKLNTNVSSSNDIEDCIGKTIEKSNGIAEPIIPISSIELTPGTDYMERINKCMEKYMEELGKKGIKYIYSSYHDEGEGEHKILQYIKNNLTPEDSIVIYGLDADLLFLSLGIGWEYDLYVMREKQVFANKEVDLDEVPDYNFVEIKQLHLLISNLNVSTEDFIVLCYLIGNDFMPGLLTTDVKKGGLDKIFRAWDNLKTKLGLETEFDETNQIKSQLVYWDKSNSNSKPKINRDMLKGLFEELVWTEKYVWKNINRDNIIGQENLEPDELEKLKYVKQDEKREQMEKFILGESTSTDFLEKIEFSSPVEYYSYYLGINCMDIDKTIIKKMTQDYLNCIEWCIGYYLDRCPSWTFGYNFIVAPLIKDIINFFPVKSTFKFSPRTLNPVEQLVLAIPPQTYKYVIEKNIIEQVKANRYIGYMIPEEFSIDVNKEHIFWKCQVRIPIVEYDEFITQIKRLNIQGEKNKIYGPVLNLVKKYK